MSSEPVSVIFDTDFDTDCDDVGALAVLHALANRGDVRFLGVVSSIPVPSCVPCIQTMNASFGREALPVGGVRVPDWENNPAYVPYRRHRESCMAGGRIYNDRIAQACPGVEKADAASLLCGETQDAVALYRRLLSEGVDGGTTVCAVGTLTALAQLLQSPGDQICPLTGFELVSRKVAQLVTMAIAEFPSGHDRFNWRMDLPSAAYVVEHWPTRLVVSSLGGDVLTGKRFVGEAPEGHPAALAYRLWFGNEIPLRPSWDQIAVMYAARADVALFEGHYGQSLSLDGATGKHMWRPGHSGRDRGYISRRVSASVVAEAVEDLMIQALQDSAPA